MNCKIDVTDGSKADWDACGISEIANRVKMATDGANTIYVLVNDAPNAGLIAYCGGWTYHDGAGDVYAPIPEVNAVVTGQTFGDYTEFKIVFNNYDYITKTCEQFVIVGHDESRLAIISTGKLPPLPQI